jgi:hypothetical protein
MLCCGIDPTGKFFLLINRSELSLQCYLRKFLSYYTIMPFLKSKYYVSFIIAENLV